MCFFFINFFYFLFNLSQSSFFLSLSKFLGFFLGFFSRLIRVFVVRVCTCKGGLTVGIRCHRYIRGCMCRATEEKEAFQKFTFFFLV